MAPNGDRKFIVRVVEDTPDIAAYLKESITLTRDDIHVITTTAEFDRLLRDDHAWEDVDAAIVDMMLPGVSGADILRYLSEVHPHIRRVVLTASLPHAQDAESLADVVLFKPARINDILDALGV